MANIGFIGLGHMGLPMAINLLKAGHNVAGFDLQSSAIQALVDAGGRALQAAKEAALKCDVVITMLQTGSQVEEVALGDKGFLIDMPANSMFIDCSTIDVTTARKLNEEAYKKNVLSVDAPVSGGVAGAKEGRLTFMVGGSEQAFNRAQEILAAMGKKIIHAGDSGSGQAGKICNNMILGISMIGVAEAFLLAEKLGLSAQKLYEITTNASGQCWVMNNYVPVAGVLENVPANKEYQPGFTVAMMLKDLRLSQEVAKESALELPLSEKATALFQQCADSGKAQLDFSSIIEIL